MSYVLYSAIARAGGIDLLLSRESFPRPHPQPAKRRAAEPVAPARRQRPGQLAGRALIGLGQTLTRWGRRWAPQQQIVAANTNLTFATK